MKAKTFAEWMREVDRALAALCGMVSSDLPDVGYDCMYDDGATPEGAARKAIRYATYEEF